MATPTISTEAELAVLIAEQQRDDTYYQPPERRSNCSFELLVSEPIGMWDDEVVNFLPPVRGRVLGYRTNHRYPWARPATPIPHGTESGYVNHRCRCIPCTEASRSARNERNARQREREPWHGTVNGYDYHKCRCKPCKRAKYRKTKRQRRRKLGLPVDLFWRSCAHVRCGQKFRTNDPRKTYCSARCAKLAWWDRNRDEVNAAQRCQRNAVRLAA